MQNSTRDNKNTMFHTLSIRHRLILITTLVVCLIIIVSLTGFQMVMRTANEILYEQTANSLNVISSKITARLTNIVDASLYLAVNKDIQSSLTDINEDNSTSIARLSRQSIQGQLYQMHQRDIIAISIVPLYSQSIIFTTSTMTHNDVALDLSKQLASTRQGGAVWLSTSLSDNSLICAREIRNVNRPFLDTLGYVIIRLDMEQIVRESVREVISGDYNINIRQADENIFPFADSKTSSIPFIQSRYGVSDWHGVSTFITVSEIDSTWIDWSIQMGIPYDNVFHTLNSLNQIFIVSIIITALMAVLLSQGMSNNISRSIKVLTHKMERVQSGNLELYVPPTQLANDELGTLNRDFDEMTIEFKRLIQDNYEKELLLSKTQLKALEQQLNPHFLYNSLDTINWFARRGEGQEVSKIAQALGSLLRQTLSEDGDSIALQKEIVILDSYLSIQKIRFQDRLVVISDYDAAAMSVLVPKMSIQPLVENAVMHALEESIDRCTVMIDIKLVGHFVEVEVRNDGSYIDVDILNKLRTNQVKARRTGVGLSNIDQRIKLLYGQDYGLSFANIDGFACVSYRIPAISEGGSAGEARSISQSAAVVTPDDAGDAAELPVHEGVIL